MPYKSSSNWVLIFVFYFLAHALIRTALGSSMTEDEIRLLQNAHKLAWLYNGEMPLYAWMQGVFINAFGPTILSLALMKNTIMLIICLSIFKLVERVSNPIYALAAAISLLFVPQLVWTSQHGLSAPVLATMFAATTMLAFSRLSDDKSVPKYGVFGAMIGLGAISSLSYLLVPAALLLAAITSVSYRNIIFNSGFIAVFMVAGFIVFWPYYELFQTGVLMVPTLSEVSSFTHNRMFDQSEGLYGALQTTLTFSGLLILGTAFTVYTGLGRNRRVNNATGALRQLMLRTVAFGMILIFTIAFLFGGAWMDQASLQPVLFLLAPVLALYLFPAMSIQTHRRAVAVSGVIAVMILIVTPAHYSFGDQWTLEKQAAYTLVELP